MSLLWRKLSHDNFRKLALRHEIQSYLSYRQLSILPTLYDGEHDPAPKFFAANIQALLTRLTRPDINKIFKKRTSAKIPVLRTPTYKFLTDEELQSEIKKANNKANILLQMPPVLKVMQPINDILSKDPALIGYDTATYLFTDITFGGQNETRMIVQRDPDGTLHSCDHDIRKRMNQTYFPIEGRKIKDPMMFANEELLHSLLDREKYEFVLDRACIQYEPDEPSYQKVTSITYQHVDLNKKYDLLRSTRHFGPLVFYLTWHQSVDNLMLELIQSGAIREAVVLVGVRHALHADVQDGDAASTLAREILLTPVQLTKSENLTEEDIQLDNKCIECVQKYIISSSAMKSQHELALQGFREYYQHLIELNRGLRKAHGNS